MFISRNVFGWSIFKVFFQLYFIKFLLVSQLWGYYMLTWLMWGILRVVCPVKVNASHVVLCEPYQKFKPSKIDFIILYNPTLKVHFFHLWIFATVCPNDTKAKDINGKGKQNFWPTCSFYFVSLGDKWFVLRNIWETELLLQSLKQRNHTPVSDLFMSVLRLRRNP